MARTVRGHSQIDSDTTCQLRSIAGRSPERPINGGKDMKCRFVIPAGVCVLLLLLVPGTAASQTLLTETTWGGAGAEFAEDVATAADGSA
jgi:hypothetical protein